jgi:hypothetical protein
MTIEPRGTLRTKGEEIMSETETRKGRLIPTNQTVQEIMETLKFPEYYNRNNPEDVLEYFKDAFYESKIEIEGVVYNIEGEDLSYEDIFEAKQMSNGEIHYLLKYHNGGCGFHDALEYAIKNMEGSE